MVTMSFCIAYIYTFNYSNPHIAPLVLSSLGGSCYFFTIHFYVERALLYDRTPFEKTLDKWDVSRSSGKPLELVGPITLQLDVCDMVRSWVEVRSTDS